MTRIETWARRAVVLGLAAAGLLWGPLPAGEASGIGTSRLVVDFTKPDEAQDLARWSMPDRVHCTREGLGWSGSPRSSINASVHVTKPLAIGHAWWAATNARVQARATWTAEAPTTPACRLYVRHSPDAEAWSQWLDVPYRAAEPGARPAEFILDLRIPQLRRHAWSEQVRSYRRFVGAPLWTDWQVDLAAHLEAEHPGFLARTKPFYGYMQFLLEVELRGGHRLRSLAVDVSYVVPGPAGPPTPAAGEGNDAWRKPWAYRVSKQELAVGTRERASAVRAVLAAALRAFIAKSGGGGIESKLPPREFALWDRTGIWLQPFDLELTGKPLEPEFEGLKAGAKDDFVRRNHESRLLPHGLDAGLPFHCESAESGGRLLDGGPGRVRPGARWLRWHARHPGSLGLLWVSEPGFSTDGTQAVVHVSRMWRELAGYGRFFLLERKGESWDVVAVKKTWIS